MIFTFVIVGRPNVGKSSLFNKLAGKQLAITDAEPGVTRDRKEYIIEGTNFCFKIIDTGGVCYEKGDIITQEVENQIFIALQEAHHILFVVDVKDGITPLDKEIAVRLKKLNKPVTVIVNKVDNRKYEMETHIGYQTGFDDIFYVSCANGKNIKELKKYLGEIASSSTLPKEEEAQYIHKDIMKIALVGRRNVGKSSIINSLLDDKRVIVSEIPGTTVDSIDVEVIKDNKKFIMIDTAGLRKKGKYSRNAEFFSFTRTFDAIRRCDVAILVLDAMEVIGEIEKKIAEYVEYCIKPCILAINKWDLVKDENKVREYAIYVEKKLPFIYYAPIIFISAVEKFNLWKMIDLAQDLYKQASIRISTGKLNRILEHIKKKNPLKGKNIKKTPKIYYITQVGTKPPHFVLSVNHKELFSKEYLKYVKNYMRDTLSFKEIPIKITLKEHHKK